MRQFANLDLIRPNRFSKTRSQSLPRETAAGFPHAASKAAPAMSRKDLCVRRSNQRFLRCWPVWLAVWDAMTKPRSSNMMPQLRAKRQTYVFHVQGCHLGSANVFGEQNSSIDNEPVVKKISDLLAMALPKRKTTFTNKHSMKETRKHDQLLIVEPQ